nr:SAM-dependent methyltransferase [uncultured Actinoplanes sp.]
MTPPPEMNPLVPHSARIYDYLLGGKDNFEADRKVGDRIREQNPGVPISMRANRRFMIKSVRWFAEQGFRQFLDLGTGLPVPHPNLHEVVQEIDPAARVVYVDNDPLIMVHARALMTSTPQGSVTYLEEDLRTPEKIMNSAAVRDQLDLTRPVAVSIIAVLQHIVDDDQARGIIDALMGPLVPGSALALSVVTVDHDPDGEKTIAAYNSGGVPVVARTHAQTVALFDGLQVQPPGVVQVHKWRPADEDEQLSDETVYMYGGVAFKR